MRDSTKAITGSKQIFEPVVKGTLHTHVTRNPMNKQITYKHCKSPPVCRTSSEANCCCETLWRTEEIQGQATFASPSLKGGLVLGNKAQGG